MSNSKKWGGDKPLFVVQDQGQIIPYMDTVWHDMLVPKGWQSFEAKCRYRSGWIEFRGRFSHPDLSGWPAAEVKLLPKECTPKSPRHTTMACHGSGGLAQVCNNDVTQQAM